MEKTCSKNLYPKPYSLSPNLGFTLIELLITMTIITLLFSIGIAQYNKFNRRQILAKAKDELVSNLRLAQGKSLAAEKPTTCTDTLAGHKVKFTDNQNYKIVAVCGNEVDVKNDLSLPTNVTATIQPPEVNNEVFFRVLSQGSPTDTTITLSGFGETTTVAVTTSGEIK
jgi:prepilin-type N-terminal cleavage/methylation domain-containing protein